MRPLEAKIVLHFRPSETELCLVSFMKIMVRADCPGLSAFCHIQTGELFVTGVGRGQCVSVEGVEVCSTTV